MDTAEISSNENEKNKGAVNALLSEYEKAIRELQKIILSFSASELVAIADSSTTDPTCRSAGSVLTHVVSAGYSYCVYIRNSRGDQATRPLPAERKSAAEFAEDLDSVMRYTTETFAGIVDDDLCMKDEAELMITSWRQRYDIEQMMEHAIVHILRHRRQLERFQVIVSGK